MLLAALALLLPSTTEMGEDVVFAPRWLAGCKRPAR